MKVNSISDDAIVLSRVNYGETDRILNILCQKHGKLSVIAKGVRKGKSKLAGGIELFAKNELVLLKGKGELYIVTSSRMKNYFSGIVRDLDASSYAYECLKAINKLVPEGAGEEYYEPLENLLKALDDNKIPLTQIKLWFGLKILNNQGSLPNFKTDNKGKQLEKDSNFSYDFDKHCFFTRENGDYTADHIKILRHLADSKMPVEIKTTNGQLIDEPERLISQILHEYLS